jgi:hypothetical protein
MPKKKKPSDNPKAPETVQQPEQEIEEPPPGSLFYQPFLAEREEGGESEEEITFEQQQQQQVTMTPPPKPTTPIVGGQWILIKYDGKELWVPLMGNNNQDPTQLIAVDASIPKSRSALPFRCSVSSKHPSNILKLANNTNRTSKFDSAYSWRRLYAQYHGMATTL